MREFPRYFTDSATQYDAALVSGAACYSKERNKTDFLSAGYVEGAAPCRRGNETVLFRSDGIDLLSLTLIYMYCLEFIAFVSYVIFGGEGRGCL